MASRLTEMRNERNARAKTAAAKKASPKAGANVAGQLTFEGLGDDIMNGDDGMQLITPGGNAGNRGIGSKNKSKKKKKKKNKR